MDSTLTHNVSRRLFPFLPKGFLEHNLFGLIRILSSTTLCPARTSPAIFALVSGGGDKLAVFYFRTLPAKSQFFALSTGETVFLPVVCHVFHSANLFLKLFALLLIVVGGLDEADLSVLLQIQVVLQAFIARICYHFLVPCLVPPGQFIQHWAQSFHIRPV